MPSPCATKAEGSGSMRWFGKSLLSLFRGAIWGCLTSLIGSAIFWGGFLVPRVPDELFKVGYVVPEPEAYAGALVFTSLYIGILTIIPATILVAIAGMALGLLIHLDESIGSSIFASVSAGGIVGLATTSLLVATFLFGLEFGMGYLSLGLYAILIGAIAGSITGWRLSAG